MEVGRRARVLAGSMDDGWLVGGGRCARDEGKKQLSERDHALPQREHTAPPPHTPSGPAAYCQGPFGPKGPRCGCWLVWKDGLGEVLSADKFGSGIVWTRCGCGGCPISREGEWVFRLNIGARKLSD